MFGCMTPSQQSEEDFGSIQLNDLLEYVHVQCYHAGNKFPHLSKLVESLFLRDQFDFVSHCPYRQFYCFVEKK